MRMRSRGIKLSGTIKALIGCMGCLGVIGIILYPLINSDLGPEVTRACLSNVKQLDLALLMYAQDWDEHLPDKTRWMDTTLVYLKDEIAFRCPTVVPSTPPSYGYAFNNKLAGIALTKVSKPATLSMLYDAANLERNANAPGLVGLAMPPRHHGRNNIGYADGHAKSVEMISSGN